MIAYFIELAIVHMLLSLAYVITMRGERQYQLMRWFLIITIPVAIIVPLISFEGFFLPSNSADATAEFNTFIGNGLSPIVIGTQSVVDKYVIIRWAYILITSAFLFHFLLGLWSIFKLFFQSHVLNIRDVRIRLIKEKGSFTFFRWIFIHENVVSAPDHEVILQHELAHARQLHSLDILLMNAFRTCCWFLPSAWWLQKEIKRIHEYEADLIALRRFGLVAYSNTLIKHTLRSKGLVLTNSFHGGSVLKRINALKKQMKFISGWKLATLCTLYAILITTFSCNDKLDREIEKLAEGNSPETEIPVQAKELLESLHNKNPEKTYAYKELAVEEGEQVGTVYDIIRKLHVEGDLVSFFYLKDRIGVVVELKDYTAEKNPTPSEGDQIFTIVQNPPEFPGGLEAFYQYIAENLSYPTSARSAGVEGRVYVEFIVDKDGAITKVKAVKGIGSGCDLEAERVLRTAPKFKPGTQRGQSVKVKMVLPIIFKLDQTGGA